MLQERVRINVQNAAQLNALCFSQLCSDLTGLANSEKNILQFPFQVVQTS